MSLQSSSTEPLKTKLAFCWLALISGVVGGHWIYCGKKRFVFYVCTTPLSAFAGWADCLRYGLMPDEDFNRKINPNFPSDTKQTNGLVVTAIILALGFFVTALMSLLAVVFQLIIAGSVA